MKFAVSSLCIIAAFGLAVASPPASAQEVATVGGLTVNLGVMSAESASKADGHRDAHPLHPSPAAQHLLITLDDQKSGKRIGDAEVVIEVTDPRGRVERRPLLHTQAGGLADYSELFEFGWSGKYAIHVIITPRPGAKPIEAQFTVTHTI